MKPYFHARISAHQNGGEWEEYQEIHDFFDLSKGAVADMRHRMILHSDLGCKIAEMKFGSEIHLKNGKTIPLSVITEQHQIDDLGRIVTIDEWLTYIDKPSSMKIKKLIPSLKDFRQDPLKAAVKKWGGEESSYEQILSYYDIGRTLSDNPLVDLVLLNAFGIMLSDYVFGPVMEVSPGRFVPTRDFGETLALARLGKIPPLEEILSSMRTEMWMYGSEVAAKRRAKKLGLDIPITD